MGRGMDRNGLVRNDACIGVRHFLRSGGSYENRAAVRIAECIGVSACDRKAIDTRIGGREQ